MYDTDELSDNLSSILSYLNNLDKIASDDVWNSQLTETFWFSVVGSCICVTLPYRVSTACQLLRLRAHGHTQTVGDPRRQRPIFIRSLSNLEKISGGSNYVAKRRTLFGAYATSNYRIFHILFSSTYLVQHSTNLKQRYLDKFETLISLLREYGRKALANFWRFSPPL